MQTHPQKTTRTQPRLPTTTEELNANKPSNALSRLQSLVLQLNKLGMEHLARQQFKQAAEHLKKAENIILEQVLQSDRKDQGLNRLLGITLNNLGCYYKKTNKPKVALKYLKQALEIEVYNVEDWISTAGTHLNICAIFSLLGKHKEAAEHAHLAIRLLERERDILRSKKENFASLNNVLIVSYYNLGVEREHLKDYFLSKAAYEKGYELAKQNNKLQNMNMYKIMEENINRLSVILEEKEKKMQDAEERKREMELAGHYDYMRKHKRRSLMRESVAVGSKKFPTYVKGEFRSASIEQLPSPIYQAQKQRSPGRYDRQPKELRQQKVLRL